MTQKPEQKTLGIHALPGPDIGVKFPEADELSDLRPKPKLKAILLKLRELDREQLKLSSELGEIHPKIRDLQKTEHGLQAGLLELKIQEEKMLWKLDQFIPSLIEETKEELRKEGLL